MESKGDEDLSKLSKLDEDSILATLRDRYARDSIYTDCGEILIAVNPYKKLSIFDLKDHDRYDWRKFDATAPPHVFHVASRAYQRMRESKTNQVILVSGESGAGKTESTKLMVKHFVHMCPHGCEDLHDKVVKVNPLLEAFGNAQTIMNENSSRFAKYLELSFEESGQVLGAVVRDYMLEKSRVVKYSCDEGNFHIFYSLFAGASKEQLAEIGLTEAKNYKIIKQGSDELLQKTEDYQRMYSDQMSVLQQIGFDQEDMTILHWMLGAILNLTEVQFKEPEKQNDPLVIVNPERVETVAKLLSVKASELGVALLKTKTDYGGFGGFQKREEIHVLKNLDQARDGRDALAKAIYERLFGWVIRRINEDLNPTKQRHQVAATIGILDIAGFENLHVNSFEQLCINFVNEQLQNFMNDTVFKTERRIYHEEGIPCSDVDFKSNADILEVFAKKNTGIFFLLDEETKFQMGSDEKFVDKVTSNNAESGVVTKCSTNDPVFGITHFAGTVWYSCSGFLEKNKDTVNDDLTDCMKDSENDFIRDLFTVKKGPTGTISETQFNLGKSKRATQKHGKGYSIKGLGRSLKKYKYDSKAMANSYSTKRNNTVTTYFRESMSNLLDKMKRSEPHFVRCLKPNARKMKENFNATMIKEQLLYNGITEIAKIRSQGYPVRTRHSDFYRRYCILDRTFPKKVDNYGTGAKSLIDKILPESYKKLCKLGKHQVFMKEIVHMFLEKSVYLRERAARRSMEDGILVMATKRRAAKQLAYEKKQEEEKKQQELDRKRKEDEQKRQALRTSGKKTSPPIEPGHHALGTSGKKDSLPDEPVTESKFSARNLRDTMHFKDPIGSTLGSTASSKISNSSEEGSSDTSSSGRMPVFNLGKTKGRDGWMNVQDKDETTPKFVKSTTKTKDKDETTPKFVKNTTKTRPPKPPPTNRIPKDNNKEDPKPTENKPQKEFWDIFADIPREKKSKDVHERGSLRVIKVITYGLLFLILFAALVFQKISLMLLVHKQDKNFTVTKVGTLTVTQEMKDNYKKIEPLYNSARYLLLVVATCIPYILTLAFSVLRKLFGNAPFPSRSTLILACIMEIGHSIGLGFLIFKYLGEMHSARGIIVLSATCILPSILKPFFAKDSTSSVCKRITCFVADLVAIVAQISVIPLILKAGFLIDTFDEGYELETNRIVEVVFCLLLCSFSWWENFMDDRAFGTSKGRLQQFLLHIKFDLQKSRPAVTMVTSMFKIATTVTMAYLLRGDLDLDVVRVFNSMSEPRYENSVRSVPSLHYDDVKDFTSIICLTVGSFVAYYVAYTICKLRMQIVSFSLAALLSTPVAVTLVMLDCYYGIFEPFTMEQLECYHTDSYDKDHWYHILLGLIWIASTYWIARYIWYPNQERLAKIERLFVNPFYCSILLEQHLIMNRKRHNKRIRKEVDRTQRDKKGFIYRLNQDDSKSRGESDRSDMKKIPPMIYACATMWHENRLEMVQLLKSLYRVDYDQFIRKCSIDLAYEQRNEEDVDPEEFEYYEFQAHILFDDAFEFDKDDIGRIPNSFVRLMTEVMQEAANAVHHKQIRLAQPMIIPSPYGAQLVYEMPGGNLMYVHLKDKNKIRHRKRWSQVMYMYYLLGYRIVRECQERVLQALANNTISELATWNSNVNSGNVGKSEIFSILDDQVLYRAENTFILALDGDVDFTPKAVRLLIDRMKKNEELGASCGRIHPIGKGPMVWYQKFEYAVAHWLQKATEHVLGCVLCSPGCFSLFRGSALMDDNVMRKYTIKPTEASHHLMYDQGEDRWLCTLLLQQGYRVDYAAASDAFTYAPEGFGEFFNQRRRWMPSTIANIMDLLTDASNTVSINNNISWLYIFYQGALMVSTLIGPGTVVMMIAGSYLTVFSLDLYISYALALGPAIFYTILCFTIKPKYQIMIAEIFSAIYAFIMMVVLVGSIITAAKESPLHPSVIFLASMVFIFLFAAVIHPWEFSCIIYGALYFLCVPSGFLLLVIYSLVNLNVVSWGTREVPKKKTKEEIAEEERKLKEKEEKKKQGWFSRLMPKFQLQDLKGLMEFSKSDKEDQSIKLLEQMNKNMEKFMGIQGQGDELQEVKVESKEAKPKKTVSFAAAKDDSSDEKEDDGTEKDETYYYEKKKKDYYWVEQKEFKSGTVITMNQEEKNFWENFIGKYLEPLDISNDEKKKTTKELAELRNNVVAGFSFINLIWIAINFMFQLKKPAVINFPIKAGASEVQDQNIKIDALGLLFVIFFVLILFIQFVGMIIHRWGTFMHLIAITEIPNPFKKEKKDNQSTQQNTGDILRLCEQLAGEPEADYPSDDEEEQEEEDKRRAEILKERITNWANQGVDDDLRNTRRLGRSLRDTRHNLGESRSNFLRKTARDPNFDRGVKDVLSRTKIREEEEQDEEGKGFKPNVLRYRGKPKADGKPEAGHRFGNTAPIFSDFMDKIQERRLERCVQGAQKSDGNIRRTIRQGAYDDDYDEPLYDEIPANLGTLGRKFYKKLHKVSKYNERSLSNSEVQYRQRNGDLNSIELNMPDTRMSRL